MNTFVSIPTQVRAVEWDGRNYHEVLHFIEVNDVHDSKIGVPFRCQSDSDPAQWGLNKEHYGWGAEITAAVYDHLHNTWVGVKTGQWIIFGTKGEFYPCDADVFQAKYKPGTLESVTSDLGSAVVEGWMVPVIDFVNSDSDVLDFGGIEIPNRLRTLLEGTFGKVNYEVPAANYGSNTLATSDPGTFPVQTTDSAAVEVEPTAGEGQIAKGLHE